MNNIQSVAMVFIHIVKFNLLINYIIKINNNNNVSYEILYIYIDNRLYIIYGNFFINRILFRENKINP